MPSPSPSARTDSNPSVSHLGEILCCGYSRARGLVASGGWDGQVSLWDSAAGAVVAQWKVGEKPVTACALTPDGNRLMTGSMDGLLGQWDVHTHKQIVLFLAHTRPISGIAFSSDGKMLATASWDRLVTLWDTESVNEIRRLKGHEDLVAGCQFCPDGRNLLSWSHDSQLGLWEAATGAKLALWHAHDAPVTAGAASPDGRWFASAGRDGSVSLWDAATQEPVARYLGSSDEIRACFFSVDAELVITVSAAGEIVLHAVPHFGCQTGKHVSAKVHCATLAGTGDRLVLGTEEGQLLFEPLEIAIEKAMYVTAVETREAKPLPGLVNRLLGREQLQRVFRCTCPVCHQAFELDHDYEGTAICPQCTRKLRVNSFTVNL